MKTPADDPAMASFFARVAEVNALAEAAPGFVWRLKDDSDGSVGFARPFEDERLLFTMSVWESLEHLRAFVYKNAHAGMLRQREDWFHKPSGAAVALWWVPVGQVPTVADARARLESVQANGPTPFAFTFAQPFQSPGSW